MSKRIIIIAALLVAMVSLSGCTMKYTFDFVKEKDAVNSQGEWYAYEDIEFLPLGAYMHDDALVSPYRFRGDFTVNITFLLNIGTTNYLNWLDIYLVDSDDWGYDDWIGLGMYGSSTSTITHWIGQKPALEVSGVLPGLYVDDVNHLQIKKTGDAISLIINDQMPAMVFTISAENLHDDYNILISSYDDGNTEHKGMYVQKVVVTYESGNATRVDK